MTVERTGVGFVVLALAGLLSIGGIARASEGVVREAAALYRSGKTTEARSLLEARIAEEPGDVDARLAYVQLRVALGERERVRKEYDELALKDPSNPAVRLAQLVLLSNSEEKPERFRKYLLEHPDFERGWEEYGRTRLEEFHVSDAREAFLKAIEIEPGRAAVHLYLGLAYRAEGKGDEEEAAIRKAIALDPASEDARLELGTTLAFKGKLLEAGNVLGGLLQEIPDDPEALALLAYVNGRLGRPAEARALKERALAEDPRFPGKLLYLGLQSGAAPTTDLAKHFLALSIFLDSTNGEAWSQLGLIHRRERDFDRAIECYAKVCGIDEKNRIAWRNLGMSHGDKGDLEKAELYLRKSVDVDPDYVVGWIDYARIRQKRGEYPGAIEAWNRVLQMAPYGWEAHEARRAISYLERGEPVPEEEARNWRSAAKQEALKRKQAEGAATEKPSEGSK